MLIATLVVAIVALIKPMHTTKNGCSCDNDAIVEAVKDSGLFMMHYQEIYPKKISFKDEEGADDVFEIYKDGGTCTFLFQDQEVYFAGNNGNVIYHFGNELDQNFVQFYSKGTGSWCYNYNNTANTLASATCDS
ncbi:MAG: hypothetical protein CMM15_03955 [Rhodospirillaceae bacterium]|nr:hypothetical protein [Rhodospirillaceae bacterium]